MFNEGSHNTGSEAQAEKWQKDYFQGGLRFGTRPPDHRTKLTAKDFAYRPK